MSTYENGVYSFKDVTCTIAGPNIAVNVTGTADEGYAVEFEGDKDQMVVGAGGDAMHSLRAAQPGMVMLRLLKTSRLNQVLCNAYNFQTLSAANHGQNTIVIDDPVRGDTITCTGAAFRKFPNISYAVEGGTQDWAFNVSYISPSLGAGVGTIVNG